MKNARRYDSRITIGGVPDQEDLEQLRHLKYRTLVDVRDQEERFGGFVEKKARALDLAYVSIPIAREAITLADAKAFYRVVFEEGSEPVYAFSRFGKRPLALLLLLEVVARGDPLYKVYQRASAFALDLEGDIAMRAFLVDFYNSNCLQPIVDNVRKLRPEIFEKSRSGREDAGADG